MIQKKSPRCLAAVGADQKGGKEFLASSDLATPARQAQGESCANCQFFRRVALPSGRDRLLCMMTGEKLHSVAGWCDLFAAGKWEELRLLTCARCLGQTELPQTVRGVTDAFRMPHMQEKSGLFCFVSIPATGVSCERRSILTGHLQYPRGLAASDWPGRVSRLFLRLQNPKQVRWFMHSIPLFRPASCGGRASLSFLLRKLARAGETAALVALLGTSLSTSARVRWAMLGHVLTVVEVRHAA
ncbi:MAG TPA: hypothetical protein DHV46_02600 [Desulfovibrio piger]|uniref:High potential iron-sulfur proteins family profile domain-containing protein n=4 Tax=Desulfovibrionaceae TaxID=194924 RepID=B6WVK6_9BACT|nr:hypothetical protein DESPIG_02124 [Desulfovibrio piger ATCC 29098]HCZ43447.1 hypothetical protein [Desulfovibrio piger]